MFYEKEFIQTVELSMKNDTIVKFAENLEFTVPKLNKHRFGWYKIKDVKGDFEITKFTRNYDNGQQYIGEFYRSNYKLEHHPTNSLNYTFYILVKIEMKEMCVVNYPLCIPSTQLRFIKFGHFIKCDFLLPGYDDFKFTYYIKKISKSIEYDTEIHIENPYCEIEIQGKQGDFKYEQSSTKDVDLLLTFGFNPSILIKTSTPAATEENNEEDATVNTEDQASIFEPQLEQNEVSSINESRPESVIQTELSTTTSIGTKLQTIGSNKLFADVFFIFSDGTKIPSHRCILAGSSNILMQIFKESTEIPVQIDADVFDADAIESALNFLYDKPDAINGKEMNVFMFAVEYGIDDLIDACCSFFEASVDSSNVCEFIQIAYLNNFKELKQKCLIVLVQKKDEINSSKIADLPKNIVVDAFCFKL